MSARTRFKPFFGLCLAVLALGCLLAMAEDEKPAKAKISEKAPNFTLKDTKEQERSLSDFKGKIVILEWTNPECPYVRKHYGPTKSMEKTSRKVKEIDNTVVWLAIDSTYGTTGKKLDFWIEQHDIKYPILLDSDGTVGHLYDARRTPHMFVIDKKGVLRYHGAIDDNPLLTKPEEETTNYVVNAVRQIVKGDVVSPDYVKPYGCTVKYKRPAPGG